MSNDQMDFTCTRKIQPRQCYCVRCSSQSHASTHGFYMHALHLRLPSHNPAAFVRQTKGNKLISLFPLPFFPPNYRRALSKAGFQSRDRREIVITKDFSMWMIQSDGLKKKNGEAPHFWNPPRSVYRFLTSVNSIYRLDSIRHGARGPVLKIVIASSRYHTQPRYTSR